MPVHTGGRGEVGLIGVPAVGDDSGCGVQSSIADKTVALVKYVGIVACCLTGVGGMNYLQSCVKYSS